MLDSNNKTIAHLNTKEMQKVNGGNGIVSPDNSDGDKKKKKNIFIVH